MRKHILIEKVATAGTLRNPPGGASKFASENVEALAVELVGFKAETQCYPSLVSPARCGKIGVPFKQTFTSDDQKITRLAAQKWKATSKLPKSIMQSLKPRSLLLLAVLLAAGCATTSTIQSREQERAAAYASFSPHIKAMVNQGRIAVGMTPAAVYIAWGKPQAVLQSGNRKGVFSTWVYRGAFLEETRYWVGRRFSHLAHDYEPRNYVRAEIVFANGKVQSWRTLPKPTY